MSKARDEKIKLTANLLNTMSSTSFSVGIAGPSVAYALNLGNMQNYAIPSIFLISILFWVSFGIMLHIAGRMVLNRMDV